MEALGSVIPDTFYLGLDQYVTGIVDTNFNARKLQLVVNGQLISSTRLFNDDRFELDSKGTIKRNTDIVDIIVLDNNDSIINQSSVSIKEQTYSLTINPYTSIALQLYMELLTIIKRMAHFL